VFFLKIRDIIRQVEFSHDLGDVFRGDHTLCWNFVGYMARARKKKQHLSIFEF
jgi:hypothetical protein